MIRTIFSYNRHQAGPSFKNPIKFLLMSATLSLLSWNASALTAQCVDPATTRTWRVSWNEAASAYGNIVNLTGFHSRLGLGTWESEAGKEWEMRWENSPQQLNEFFNPGYQPNDGGHGMRGTLAQLQSSTAVTYVSPRFVAPNGRCQIYLYPFANGQSTWKKVIVVGDSLTQSLNDETYNQNFLQGYVHGNLNTNSLKAEVEGQGGRRFADGSNWDSNSNIALSPLDAANSHLMDELRGLRSATNLRAIVVALGANDAGFSALGATAEDRDTRLEWTLAEINNAIDEMVSWGKCVVLVTPPDGLSSYGYADPWAYAYAAQSINQLIRNRTDASTTDKLLLADFAKDAVKHYNFDAPTQSVVWFNSDNLHLNDLGKLAYTNRIVQGALACP
jgi:lysophospholipase L1-like esterase